MKYDCIVIYAEKDKKLARRLVKSLHKIGIRVWFDEAELVAGDISRRKSAEILREVNYAAVILSPHFLKVEKLRRDLEALCLLEEDSGALMIMPIRHKVTAAEVKKYMPALAEKYAIQSDGEIAQELGRAMRINLPHEVRPVSPQEDRISVSIKLKQSAWKIVTAIAILAASVSLLKAYEYQRKFSAVQTEIAKLKEKNDELSKQQQATEMQLHEMGEKNLQYRKELHEINYPPLNPSVSEKPKQKASASNSMLFSQDTTRKAGAPIPFAPSVQPSKRLVPAPADSSQSMRRLEDDGVRVIEFDLVTPKAVANVTRHDRLEVSREYGGRDRQSVHAVVLRHNSAIQDLYKRALKTDSGLTGKLTTRFAIDVRGHLIHVEAVESSGLPSELIDAILSKMLEWKDFGENNEESTKENKYRLTYIFGYQN